jgi:hypothetical protein
MDAFRLKLDTCAKFKHCTIIITKTDGNKKLRAELIYLIYLHYLTTEVVYKDMILHRITKFYT